MLAAFCWPTAFKLSYWDTVRCYVLLYWNILKLDWSISPTKGNRLLRLLWGAWFLWLTTIASGKWREVPRQLSKKTKRSQVFPKKKEFVLDFWEQHPFTFGNAWQATWFDGQDVTNESHNVTHMLTWWKLIFDDFCLSVVSKASLPEPTTDTVPLGSCTASNCGTPRLFAMR